MPIVLHILASFRAYCKHTFLLFVRESHSLIQPQLLEWVLNVPATCWGHTVDSCCTIRGPSARADFYQMTQQTFSYIRKANVVSSCRDERGLTFKAEYSPTLHRMLCVTDFVEFRQSNSRSVASKQRTEVVSGYLSTCKRF